MSVLPVGALGPPAGAFVASARAWVVVIWRVGSGGGFAGWQVGCTLIRTGVLSLPRHGRYRRLGLVVVAVLSLAVAKLEAALVVALAVRLV